MRIDKPDTAQRSSSHVTCRSASLDGDADRLVAIASDGTTIDGDRQLCLFAKDLAQRAQLRHGNVVITEMSNQGLREALHEAEISTIEVPVGDRNILTELDAGRATLGGEQSGHIILGPCHNR